jgi:tRNA-Thr(GGU) m(6)t(6)A37 methyltransferase TsaA
MTRATTQYTFDPIGIVRSPFTERADAPRQPGHAINASGCIELFAGRGYEHAIDGLDGWDRIWIVFVFHKNLEQRRGWKPRVLPPRSDRKRGVFATRSPHRPNPIGLSVVVLDSIEGLSVHVKGLDLLDGTPVVDIKPYVAYADAYPDAGAGWLEPRDPMPAWQVSFEAAAQRQLAWMRALGIDLEPAIVRALSLGPAPHPYRRIRKQKDGLTLALKDWRIDFGVDGQTIVVIGLRTGYARGQLLVRPGLELHLAFSDEWDGPA